MPLLDHIVAAVARAEALPHDALRRAHPRERSLEDLRLERPELIVGCWASGCGSPCQTVPARLLPKSALEQVRRLTWPAPGQKFS